MRNGKQISPGTEIAFSNNIYWKDKQNIDKQRIDTNSRLQNFCSQKNISLRDNNNTRKEHLGVKNCTWIEEVIPFLC